MKRKIGNRLFTFFFLVWVLFWILWMPVWMNIIVGESITVPLFDYVGYLLRNPPLLGFLILLVGLAYEMFKPSLNLERDKNWKWTVAGVFLLLVIVTMVIVQEVWIPYKGGYSIFGTRSFEFPAGSGNVHAWPQLLYDFIFTHCTDTTVLALLFGLLFLTKSTPQTSRSYEIMLLGAIIWEAAMLLGHSSFLIFNVDPTTGYYSRFTRMELLAQPWFHWDFWSELIILAGAIWLLAKGKGVSGDANMFKKSKLTRVLIILLLVFFVLLGFFRPGQ